MEFNIKLKIDCREPTEIKDYFKNNAQVVFESLIVGDYIFQDESEIKLIIERKTISDLESSLKDGRFKEQRTRLLETEIKIIYIIEGSICDDRHILGAVENLALYHNICIIPSSNIKQTINILNSLIKKVGKEYNVNSSKIFKPRRKCEVNKSSLELTLETITGVSSTISKVISNEYHSVYNLCTLLNENKNLLYDLQINDKRKIGPKLAEKITNHFLN